MSKNLRDYSKNYRNAEHFEDLSRDDLDEESKAEYDRMQNRAKEYENKSEGELVNELFRKVSDGKRNGTFDPQQLDEFAKQVSPMLTAQQRMKLCQLIKMLK